jgi:hypothetical protein
MSSLTLMLRWLTDSWISSSGLRVSGLRIWASLKLARRNPKR